MPIYKMRVKDVRICHLKGCINNGYYIVDSGKDKGKKKEVTPSTKRRIKSLFNLMLDYACANDIAKKNYACLFKELCTGSA